MKKGADGIRVNREEIAAGRLTHKAKKKLINE